MMENRIIILLICVFLLVGCVTTSDRNISIDQVPMYGGTDRNAYPDLKEGDAKLIQDTTNHYGSRENASMAFVNTAFNYYKAGNLDYAMRRFNQAWLINPDNPEVFWGFASVLHDQGKYCEALRLLEKGLSKGPIQSAYKPDHAMLTAACGWHNNSTGKNHKANYYQQSKKLFIAAESDPTVTKPYLYFQWVRTLVVYEEYEEAWEKVSKFRKYSKDPFDSNLLQKLSAKMPEPK